MSTTNENVSEVVITEIPVKATPAPYIVPVMIVCAVHRGPALNVTNEDGTTNFSLLQNGRLSTTCKPCRALAANAWTTARKAYRKAFHTALRAKNSGLDVIMPNAKTWAEGDVTMLTDGRVLSEVLAEQKAERDRLRTEASEARAASANALKATKLAEREAAKLVREQTATANAEAKQLAKAERERVRAEKQATALAAKEAAAEAKAESKHLALIAKQQTATALAETRAAQKATKDAEKQAAQTARLAEREAAKLQRQADAQAKRDAKQAAKLANQSNEGGVSSEVLTPTEAVEILDELSQETSPISETEPEQSSFRARLSNLFS